MMRREDVEPSENGELVRVGEGWGNDDEPVRRPDKDGQGLVTAFGRMMKNLRLRAGLDRDEVGRQIGYAPSTVGAFEQGKRIPSPPTIDKCDVALGADGLLLVWKELVERAQYPTFFQGRSQLEKEAIELLEYDALVINGLLQTEEYMRALLAMRRPPLDEDTIEQRVAARLARQSIFDRRPAPLLSFVMDEWVLRRPYGGKAVLQGQLEHLLLIGQKRNVEIQIMPLGAVESAGVNGSFMVVTRKDGKKFVYAEAQGIGNLETDPEQATLAAARYGTIRSQALTPRESLDLIERLLTEL